MNWGKGFSFRKGVVLKIVLLRRKVDTMGKTFSSSFVRDCRSSVRTALESTLTCYVIQYSDSLKVDFQCRVIFTCVKFTFENKVEAMRERSLVSGKVNLAQLLV